MIAEVDIDEMPQHPLSYGGAQTQRKIGRVLILSPAPITDATDNVRIRARGLSDAITSCAESSRLCFGLKSDGDEVVSLPDPPGLLQRLLSPTPLLVRSFASQEFARRVRAGATNVDLCLCVGLQMVQYAPCMPPGVPILFDNYNAESDTLERVAAQFVGIKRHYWRIQAAKLRRFERWAMLRADRTIAISEEDRMRFKAISPRSLIVTIPPGLKLDKCLGCHSQEVTPGRMVFTGALNWQVNIDAVCWMARNILPRVRAAIPGASLAIVGSRPAPQVIELTRLEGVSLHVDVPDIVPWLANAAIAVAPLQYSSGVQNTVIEAMAAGKAIVATSAGAEGLDVVHGLDMVVADGADPFTRFCIELLRDPDRAEALGLKARSAARKYTQDRLTADIHRLMSEVMETRLRI